MEQDLLGIINNYGYRNQLRKLNEECYELMESIRDYEDPGARFALKKHIIEELADVTVMLKQFQAYYGITDEEIEEVMLYKIERQKKRMEDEK